MNTIAILELIVGILFLSETLSRITGGETPRGNAVSVSRPPHVKRNSMTLKMGILTEEYIFFRFFHCQFGNISYFCSWIRILCRFIDILNSEARASFSPNGNLRTSLPGNGQN